jgi:hypothetical protein
LFFVWLFGQSPAVERHTPPEPPLNSKGLLSDVRVEIPQEAHQLAAEFIRTGRLRHGRFGVDTTAVESIRVVPGRLIFNPPIRVSYDGPGPLNASTTVKEVLVGVDGKIVVDIVNSPIDVVIEEEP